MNLSLFSFLVDLLRYNDEFNNVLKTFESYMQERERRVGPAQMPIINRTASPTATSQSPSAKVNSFIIIFFLKHFIFSFF